MPQPDKGKSKAVFVPSPTSSHVSLPGVMQSPGLATPQAGSAALGRGAPHLRADPGGVRTPSKTSNAAAPTLNLSLPLQLTRRESTRATDRTDALWAEMQATLEEAELSASGGTRVFGPGHERKLSELRMAQIALAQAWARSEADDAIETISGGVARSSPGGVDHGVSGTEGAGKNDAAGLAATDGAKSTTGTGSARPGSSGMGVGGQGGLGTRLEEEAELDILLARKRREANDRYFQRVNQGVLDVVAKLEEVAIAMHAVEQESKDIWGDGDDDSTPGSIPGSAKT